MTLRVNANNPCVRKYSLLSFFPHPRPTPEGNWETKVSYEANLERVNKAARELARDMSSTDRLVIRGYRGGTIRKETAAIDLCDGTSVYLYVIPADDEHNHKARRTIAPLDAEAHPHC